jgi:hypothetical protein
MTLELQGEPQGELQPAPVGFESKPPKRRGAAKLQFPNKSSSVRKISSCVSFVCRSFRFEAKVARVVRRVFCRYSYSSILAR